jgi:hypothetical protein
MKRAWAVLVVAFSSACGGGSGGGAPIPIDQLGPRVEQIICDFEVRCGLYPDAATCMSSVSDNTPQLVADVKSGKTIYDGAQAAACLDAFTARGCNQSGAIAAPTACDKAFTGTVAVGGACFAGEECVSGDCNISNCITTMACCAGVCGAVTVLVAEGATCSPTGANCVAGTFCDSGVGGTSTCKRRGVAGAACAGPFDCADGFACVTPAGQTTGTCGAFPQTGQDCKTTDGRCDSSLDYCDPVTNKCTRRGAVGGACDGMTGGTCLPYAECDPTTSKCVGRGAVGAACMLGSDCYTGQCTAGACAARTPRAVCP